MRPDSSWVRLVQCARWSRMVIDWLALAVGFCLMLWAFSTSNLTHWTKLIEKQTKVITTQEQRTQQDKPEPAQWLNGHYANESQAWLSFEQWLNAGQFGQGHCRISGAQAPAAGPIEMGCTGAQSKPGVVQEDLNTQKLNLIIANPAQLKKQAPQTPPDRLGKDQSNTKTNTAEVVQGWIELPSGIRHFNIQNNRWQP